MIDSASDLKPEWIEGLRTVGLTAGASAPDILVQQVIARLRELGAVSLRKMDGVEEKVRFPLPLGLGDRSMAEAAAAAREAADATPADAEVAPIRPNPGH
jgi:4-hydroxy-3-methylbut-2-enyl diphosphate reductase